MISQHPPIKNAILIIVGILGSLALAAIFLVTFGNAEKDIKTTNVSVSEAQCQGKCQALMALGFNFNTCGDLMLNSDAKNYNDSCTINCKVVIKDSVVCNV